jgi:hypothetical protein
VAVNEEKVVLGIVEDLHRSVVIYVVDLDKCLEVFYSSAELCLITIGLHGSEREAKRRGGKLFDDRVPIVHFIYLVLAIKIL